MRESDLHLVSPKTPAPKYQPKYRKKRKGRTLEDYSKDRAEANKKILTLLLKPASKTPPNTGSAKSF